MRAAHTAHVEGSGRNIDHHHTVGRARDRLALRRRDLQRRNVERRREELHDAVEERLDRLVLEGAAAEDRDAMALDRGPTDRVEEFVDGRFLLVDELLHERLVVLRELLEEVVVGLLGLHLVLGGDRRLLPVLAH